MPPNTPISVFVQQGNRQVSISWALTATATSYQVQRSTDGITYTTIASPTGINYTDTTVLIGVLYYYQVAATNGFGTSAYSTPQTVVPAPTSELSLGEIRARAQQRADRVNSNFVTTPEWNFFINQAYYELYDLLIDCYEDYFEGPEIGFTANGTNYFYPLPDGVLTFTNTNNNGTSQIVAPPFYKLLGVDLALNNANNAYVTINKYNLIDRNRFVYPNTASTIYGVFNLQYRILGNQIRFIPTPAGGQIIRMLYIPRIPSLLADTDITVLGFSGWLQYVIVRAAKYALDKEESETTSLDTELVYLKGRIEETAINRDAGQPDKISDTRQGNWADGFWGGNNGSVGGW
jgi:hypothetical protein